MVSKSQLKLITSLQQKKYRIKTGLFVAEGPKVIAELRSSGVELEALFTTSSIDSQSNKEYQISSMELKRMSFLKTPNTSLALFKIPKSSNVTDSKLTVALDAIRDPGNLGTIIRLCDWYGVSQLICSEDTVDCYNPKVVQATMGSIARVNVSYVNLAALLSNRSNAIYGACMDGANVYASKLPEDAILVMGNEANGISEKVMTQLTQKLTIPRFGKLQETESLNVATATAILLSEFRRTTGT